MSHPRKWIQILVIWISLIVPCCVFGQFQTIGNCKYGFRPESDLAFGVKVGPSLNQFTKPGTFVGMNAGVFGTYKVTRTFTARMELLYSTQGGSRQDYRRINVDSSDPNSGSAISVTNINPYVKFNNIEVPVLAELGLAEFNGFPIQPKLLIGGSYSRMMGATEHKTQRYHQVDESFIDVENTRQDVAEYYKKNQFSLIAGVGINFHLNGRIFSVDMRYRQGLTQLDQVLNTLPGMSGKIYSTSFIFNCGLTLR